MLSMDEFMALFENVQHSAWRLLTLDEYNATTEEADRRMRWAQSGAVPDRSEDSWITMVKNYRHQGISFARVHVFPPREDLTDYCRYVLDSYEWNEAAGETVQIVDRNAVEEEPVRLDRDFWVIDETVVVLEYDDDGSFVGARLAEGHEADARLEQRRIAEQFAVDLATYKRGNVGRLTA